MGQYYLICCPELKEYINPHDFCDGCKLMEFGCSSNGTLTGLAILLADGCGRGGGDLMLPEKSGTLENYIGRWKNKRIVVAGDYADSAPKRQRKGRKAKDNFYIIATETYRDISLPVIMCMLQDKYIKIEWIKRYKEYPFLFDITKYKYEILLTLGLSKEIKNENKSRKPQNRKKQSRI